MLLHLQISPLHPEDDNLASQQIYPSDWTPRDNNLLLFAELYLFLKSSQDWSCFQCTINVKLCQNIDNRYKLRENHKNIPFTAQQQPKSIRNISSSNLQQQVPINLIIYLKIARHIKSDLHPFGRLHAEVRYLRTLEPHETRRHQSQRPYPSFCPKRKAPAPIAVRNTSMEH